MIFGLTIFQKKTHQEMLNKIKILLNQNIVYLKLKLIKK